MLKANVTTKLKFKEYKASSGNRLDMAMSYMTVELEKLAKVLVPKLKGALGASGHHLRLGQGRYQVWFNKEYAAVREFVSAKHYTTPGTTSGYLGKSLDFINSKKDKVIKAFLK